MCFFVVVFTRSRERINKNDKGKKEKKKKTP